MTFSKLYIMNMMNKAACFWQIICYDSPIKGGRYCNYYTCLGILNLQVYSYSTQKLNIQNEHDKLTSGIENFYISQNNTFWGTL